MNPAATSPLSVKVGSGRRIQLPQAVSDRLDWLSGPEALDCWLFVIEPGRYRLVSAPQAQQSETFRKVMERIGEPAGPDGAVDAFDAEPAESAVLAARLLPTSISPKGPPGWRLSLPRHLPPLGVINEGDEVYLIFSQGYLEVWSAERVAAALKAPIHSVLG